MRLLGVTLLLGGCRTTVVEVQVYVQGEQGEPLDTGPTQTTSGQWDTGDTAEPPPTSRPQDLLALDVDAGTAVLHPNPEWGLESASWTLPDLTGLELSLADLDGDGLDDLWGRDAAAKTMTVWLASSGGGFAETPSWEAFTNIAEAREVLIGDFDGDGLADLASWVEEQAILHVFAGTGDAVDLAAITDSTLSGVGEGTWTVADVNADGRDDAVRLSADGVAAWRGLGGRLLEGSPGLTRELDAPVDLLVEADGFWGADLATVGDDDGLSLLLRERQGWATDPESWCCPGAPLLLAGVLN